MKNDELNKLFNDWEEAIPEYRNKFVEDGIIDENKYNSTSPKILFIAKEPNSPEQKSDDFRVWWSNGVSDNFSYRLCEWTFGLLNNFPPLNTIDNNRSLYIKKIAFMNLKKVGGKSKVNYRELDKVINDQSEYIRREIEIINPAIIIGSIGKLIYWEKIFDGIEFIDSGYDIKVAEYNNRKIVHFYHPSYRVPKAMSYSLLGSVCNSEIFKNLC